MISLTDDALLNILKNEGVIKYIEDNKEQIREVFLTIIDAYKILFPSGEVRTRIIRPVIWNLLKWHPKIQNVFYLHDVLDPKELRGEEGPVCEKCFDYIMVMLEIDLEDVKFKKI